MKQYKRRQTITRRSEFLQLLSACANYTRSAMYQRYGTSCKSENTMDCTPIKTSYIKPFSDWLADGNGKIENVEKTYLYKIVKDEYDKNIRKQYYGTRGCAETFRKRYRIDEKEFDKRMVLAATAAISLLGNLSNVLCVCADDTNSFVQISTLFFSYAEKHCTSEMGCSPCTYMHWWFTSWLYNFLVAIYSPCMINDKNASTGDTYARAVYLSETFAMIMGIAFEHPKEVPYLFYVTRYYMLRDDIIAKGFYISETYMSFLALSFRQIDDETNTYNSIDEWKEELNKKASPLMLCNFVNMPSLCENLPNKYQNIIKENDDAVDFTKLTMTEYHAEDIYNLLKLNDKSSTADYSNMIDIIAKDFNREEYFEQESDKICKQLLTKYDNDDKISKDIGTSNCAIFIHKYTQAVCVMNIAHLFKCETTLSLRDELSELEHIVARLKREAKVQKDSKSALEKIEKEFKKLKQQNDKLQTRYDAEVQTSTTLRKKLNDAKAKLDDYEDTSSLKEKVKSLESDIAKEKTQNAAYKNRISTLEKRQSTERSLQHTINKLQNELENTKRLNELLMNAPEDDLRDLTQDELDLLCSIKASLVVPSMGNMYELQKLMPNSDFKFTTDDGKNPTKIPKSCDIFFFCLKFCSHSDYWYWCAQLLHVPNRCVALYTTNKNNIARAIIEKYKALQEPNE